jgi:hypothetical protein
MSDYLHSLVTEVSVVISCQSVAFVADPKPTLDITCIYIEQRIRLCRAA